MSKAFVAGLVVGVALLIVAGVAGLSHKEAQKDKEKKAYQAEIVDATSVERGVLTEKQRIHSALYSRYGAFSHFRIGTLVEEYQKEGKLFETVIAPPWEEPLNEVETPGHYFGELALTSDTVIQGRVMSKTSQVTDDDAFIFTDYDVLVTEVFKDNISVPVKVGATIVVTRPGGKVLLDGVVAKATDTMFAPLPVNKYVVLFLQFIPETGAYKATRGTGSFELDGNTLTPLTSGQFPPGVLHEGDSFLQTVRDLSNK